MKLSNDFILHNLEGETLLVPTGAAAFNGLVQGNKTVEVILECLMNDTTEDEIVAALAKRFDGSVDDMRYDVCDVIAQLRGIGAIDD